MQEDWNIILSVLESPDGSRIGNQNVYSTSPINLGRTETCDFVILDPAVSRNHAIIRVSDDYTRVFITDMSTYGTEVSGKPVPKGPGSGFTLTNGDTIKIGGTLIRFEIQLKLSAQSTFIGTVDRSFLDEPPPEAPEEEIDEEAVIEESALVSDESPKGLSPLYIGVIFVCIIIIIIIAFFE